MPDGSTVWKQEGNAALTPTSPITLSWDNGHGLVFTRNIAVDDKFMFTVTDSVANKSGAKVTLQPYAYVARDGVPQSQHYWVLHEGFVGYANGLKDPSYDDFKDETPPKTFTATAAGSASPTSIGWRRSSRPQDQSFDGSYSAAPGQAKHYQADYRLGTRTLAPGASTHRDASPVRGRQGVRRAQRYKSKFGIASFDYAIDWGWFWFITQPLFLLLDQFFHLIGISASRSYC